MEEKPVDLYNKYMDGLMSRREFITRLEHTCEYELSNLVRDFLKNSFAFNVSVNRHVGF